MSSIIRKISIGSDYKTDAMHYSIGQSVYGGHTISHILSDKEDNSYNIFIKKQKLKATKNNDEFFDSMKKG